MECELATWLLLTFTNKNFCVAAVVWFRSIASPEHVLSHVLGLCECWFLNLADLARQESCEPGGGPAVEGFKPGYQPKGWARSFIWMMLPVYASLVPFSSFPPQICTLPWTVTLLHVCVLFVTELFLLKWLVFYIFKMYRAMVRPCIFWRLGLGIFCLREGGLLVAIRIGKGS